MSSVWYCIPSKRPPEEAEPILREWRERGYKIALWRDEGDGHVTADWVMHGWEYPGYARAVNVLAKQVLEQDPTCEWIVTGGDDVLPDPNHSAEEIARECSEYFANAMLKEALALWPQLRARLKPTIARSDGRASLGGD